MPTESFVTPLDAKAERTLQWLALTLTPDIAAGKGRRIVELFNGTDRLFTASLTELEAAGMPGAAAQSLAFGRSLELASDELDKAKEYGARVIAQDDPEYPKRLYEIYDPPLVLYVRGNCEVIGTQGIAVVGTRHPTPYGV